MLRRVFLSNHYHLMPYTADIDGDGTLDVAEIASYMKRLYNFDEKMAEEQANKFLKEVDVDNVRLCIR